MDVVEEYFDELDFLWEHRQANLFTSDWTLIDLIEHEARSEAHLDGLRLAERHAWDLALERLDEGTTFAATAAALVLLEADEEHRRSVLEAVEKAEQDVVDGVRVALRHAGAGVPVDRLQEWSRSEEVFRAAAAMDIAAFRRVTLDTSYHRLLTAEDAAVREMGLRVAGRRGELSESDFTSALDDPAPRVRRAAFEEGARVGLPSLHTRCRERAGRDSDPDPVATRFLGTVGQPADLGLLRELAARDETAVAAVEGLGASGSVEVVPLLLELMASDELGVSATAAYKRITGAPDVEGERPFPLPLDDEEEEDGDDALPPDPEAAVADWSRREPSMSSETLWQGGVPVSGPHLSASFRLMSLEARRDAYLRYRSARGRGAVDLELEALGLRQSAATFEPTGG